MNQELADEIEAWRQIGASTEEAERLAFYSTGGLRPTDPEEE